MRPGGKRAVRLAVAACAAAALVPACGYLSTLRPGVGRLELILDGLPVEADGLRVVLIADTHVGRWRDGRAVARAVDLANAEHPDLALLLGDYTHRLAGQPQATFDDAIRPFAQLRAPLGTFAVRGNHDIWDGSAAVAEAFRRAGIPLLVDEHRRVTIPGGQLAVIGLDDLWHSRGRESARVALDGLAPGLPRITMSHNPDRFVEDGAHDVSLMVSGHTHGGQVMVPGYGPLLLPVRHRQYAIGYHRSGPNQLYVSRGVGTVTPPVRLFCPPEVTLLILRSPRLPHAVRGQAQGRANLLAMGRNDLGHAVS